MLKRLSIWLVLVVVAVLGLLFGTKYFLEPMKTDLSVVGQGLPSLVLAYENYSSDSGAALNQLNRIKKDYQTLMEFAVADLGTPQGQEFAMRHKLVNGAAVFLSAEGKPIQTTILTSDEQALKQFLDEKLALVGSSR